MGNFPKRDWENMTRYANKLGKPVLGKVCFRCRILDNIKLLRIETALSEKLNDSDPPARRDLPRLAHHRRAHAARSASLGIFSYRLARRCLAALHAAGYHAWDRCAIPAN
jgi:hypothetical protein